MMKVITEEFEKLLKDYPLYSQEEAEDPLVIAKMFDPTGSATWWITEYDPAEKIEPNKHDSNSVDLSCGDCAELLRLIFYDCIRT